MRQRVAHPRDIQAEARRPALGGDVKIVKSHVGGWLKWPLRSVSTLSSRYHESLCAASSLDTWVQPSKDAPETNSE